MARKQEQAAEAGAGAASTALLEQAPASFTRTPKVGDWVWYGKAGFPDPASGETHSVEPVPAQLLSRGLEQGSWNINWFGVGTIDCAFSVLFSESGNLELDRVCWPVEET
jgi:hypothetical protein